MRVNIIEERFAWWSRRVLDLFAIGKGACIGLFFWVWYELLGLGVNIIQHTDFSHVAVTPFKVRLFLVVLNIFPLAVVGTIIYQIFLLVRQKKQQQALCVLLILAVMLLFAFLGWLPALFAGYPFHTYNPDLSQ